MLGELLWGLSEKNTENYVKIMVSGYNLPHQYYKAIMYFVVNSFSILWCMSCPGLIDIYKVMTENSTKIEEKPNRSK